MNKLSIFFFVLITSFTFSQEHKLSDKELIKIFKNIRKTDQSHYRDSSIRNTIFRSNFQTIVNIIDGQGFPQLSKYYRSKRKRNIIDGASQITFVHVLQTKPELLLNEEMINKFKSQITKSRINVNILSFALNIFNYDHSTQWYSNVWSEEVERCFYLAVKEWGITLRDVKS
jgi:hypothetical protein